MYAYGQGLPKKGHDNSNLPKDTLGADQVYLINLDRRPDRKENMKAILDELQVKYERVNEIDGKFDIIPEYMKNHGIESEMPLLNLKYYFNFHVCLSICPSVILFVIPPAQK